MKKLIVCRHGEYDASRHLSYDGKLQIRCLAYLLRTHVGDGALHLRRTEKVKVLTSKAPRAADSARLIMQALDIPTDEVVASDFLWSGDGPQKQDDVLALLQVEQAAPSVDILIVVTHLEYCEALPSMYAHRHGLKNIPPRIQIHRGQARVLDCATGECVTVGRNGRF